MKIFKTCPNCQYVWNSRDEFLSDSGVYIIGYQVNFKELEAGFFLFNHSCGTSMAIDVESFEDLYDGPIFSEKKTGEDCCPGYCLHEHNLETCPAQCECAFVREIMQIIRG